MPILGIMASAMSANLWQPQGAYDALATVTVGATSVANITFTGIPNTYKHLQIRALVKFAGGDYGDIRFNGDTTTSNYRNHILYGIGSGTPSAVTAANAAYFPTEGRASVSAHILDILDYSNTTKNKVTRELGGFDTNGAGQIFLTSNLWMNTSAINSISITAFSGTFTQYSQFTLYGVR